MWIVRTFQILFSTCGIFLILVSIRNLIWGSQSVGWPKAPGRIIRSYVSVQSDEEGTSHTPRVEYEYSVNGSVYTGNRIRYGQTRGSGNMRQAQKTIAPFTEDAQVVVFYDPKKPNDAVLLTGTGWGNIAIAAAGGIFLAFGLMLP